MGQMNWAQLQKDATDVVIPDGDYPSMVTKSEAVESSNKKPMLKLQLTIVEGPKRDRKLFTQITLTVDNPFALKRWFSNLAAFGLDQAYFNTNPTMEQIAHDLMNRGVIAVVGHGTWQGTERNQVDGYKPYTPTGPIPPGMVIGAAVTTAAGIPNVPSTPPSAPAPTSPPSAAPQPPVAPPARPF